MIDNVNEQENLTDNDDALLFEENENLIESQAASEEELTEAAKVKLGHEIARMRKEMKKKYDQKLEEQIAEHEATLMHGQAPAAQANTGETVFDPKTGQYFDVNSQLGLVVLREQYSEEQKRIKEAEKAQKAKSKEYKQLKETLEDFAMLNPDSAEAVKVVEQYGTPHMADALLGVDDAAGIVSILGKKPGELQRIARLSPAKQQREIYRLEETMKPRKKYVTQASEPISNVNSNSKTATPPSEHTYEQMKAFYQNKYNKRD